MLNRYKIGCKPNTDFIITMDTTKQTGATVYIECECLSIALADLYLTIAKYCILEKIQQGFQTINELEETTKISYEILNDLLIELINKKIVINKNELLTTNYSPPPRQEDTVLVLKMIKLRNHELSYGEIAKKIKIPRQRVSDVLTHLLNQKNIPEKTQKAFARKQQVESIKNNQNERNQTNYKQSQSNYKEFHSVS